jgi:hypothetical protein
MDYFKLGSCKHSLTKLDNVQAGLFDARSGKQPGAVGLTGEFAE